MRPHILKKTAIYLSNFGYIFCRNRCILKNIEIGLLIYKISPHVLKIELKLINKISYWIENL